jgi:hypothetical protein
MDSFRRGGCRHKLKRLMRFSTRAVTPHPLSDICFYDLEEAGTQELATGESDKADKARNDIDLGIEWGFSARIGNN